MKRSNIARTFAIAAVTTLGLGVTPAAMAGNKGCSSQTVKGTFAIKGTGFITAPAAMAGPIATLSTITYDGEGGVTATGTISLNGNIMQYSSAGTYTVNGDCTGTYTLKNSQLGLTTHNFFVIHDGGNATYDIATDPGVVITCVSRRQYPVGDWRQ